MITSRGQKTAREVIIIFFYSSFIFVRKNQNKFVFFSHLIEIFVSLQHETTTELIHSRAVCDSRRRAPR